MRLEEEQYLEFVLKKVRDKLDYIAMKIGDGIKEIESMNDYFWDNYSEFDEYGYEMYDNKMAYKTSLSQQETYIQDKKRYDRMLDSPYFGRIDFCYEGEETSEEYYIGITNLADAQKDIPYVFDWRAPVCGLFYDYDKGPASFTAPMGTISGEITRKRQYKIRNGKLIFALETDMNIDDEILQQTLSQNADAKMRNIVTTIQREQNGIIRDTTHPIMVVQGCAGSGKTSVALHRIAYLLYHNRKTLNAAQILILSPNSIFGDYISRILPELGEENICEMTLDDYAYRELARWGEAQDRYDVIEKMLAGESVDGVNNKQQKEFIKEMDLFLMQLEWENVEIKDFIHKSFTLSEEDISRFFYEKFCDVPLLDRMNRIADYVIDTIETMRNRDMEDEEREHIQEKFRSMYLCTDFFELYQRFLSERKGEDQLIQGMQIMYEDVYPLLYFKYSLNEMKKRRKVKHLVIDEMQDYSYLQYVILRKLFQCPMTILGDKKQTMSEEQRDVMDFLPDVFGKNIFYISMDKSYRSTFEIMRYAQQLLNQNNQNDCVDRHGEEPEIKSFLLKEKMVEQLTEDLTRDNGFHTKAVLCLRQEDADSMHEELLLRGIENDLLSKDSMRFKTGVSVMPFYLAKGLEFDSVYVTDLQDYHTALHKQALYINATRALHALKLYYVGEDVGFYKY